MMLCHNGASSLGVVAEGSVWRPGYLPGLLVFAAEMG